jgi:hypothetical protein
MPPQDNTGLPWRSKRAATSPFRHIHAIEKAALTPPNRVRGLVLPSLSPSANIALWILCPAFECRQAIADVLAAHAFASTGWATIDC